MQGSPRVLFVSKPIAPPWNDGSKNLVRDVAQHLNRARPTVLTTEAAPALGGRVVEERIYKEEGRFAPSLVANARVLQRLLLADPHDIWHFVFAPNRASSTAARISHNARAFLGWKGKVVQTVASAPKHFRGVERLLFGDVVVTLSEWMRGRLIGAGVDATRLRVIPPCAAAPTLATEEAMQRFRERHSLGQGPVVVYPGDYEVSQGAITVARAAAHILREVPNARVVFACRAKTERAAEAKEQIRVLLQSEGSLERTTLLGEIPDMATLLSLASVIAFPVDDLFAKVDIPLVLLESLALGKPIIVARGGPLEAIDCARVVEPNDSATLAEQAVELLRDAVLRQREGERGTRLYEKRYQPAAVAAQYDALYADIMAAER